MLKPQIVPLTLKMQIVPSVATRGQHVLILVRDSSGRFLLGQKNAYPPGIYRMVGGGMEKNEVPLLAAQRELYEELQLSTQASELIPLTTVVAKIQDGQHQSFTFTTYVFLVELGHRVIKPSSDLDGVVRLTATELETLIKKYATLPKTLDPVKQFAWFDYGQLYGRIHQVGLDAAQAILKKKREQGEK